jgi:hypothetical protein
VIRNVPYKGFPKPPDTVRVVIHLSSNPASCKMAWPDASAEPGVACVLELSGNKVKITQLDHLAGFDGTLTPNLQLVGNWAGSIPAGFIWGPVQITLTRASSPSH